MRLGSTARKCYSSVHAQPFSSSRASCPPSLRRHARNSSQISGGSSSYIHQSQRRDHSPSNPITFDARDAVEHLQKIFPPLDFPPDVAQRMTTHVSFERGVKGHNGRLGFIGRRVLHTYLLLFLHECTLAPPSHTPARTAPIPPSGRLRPSSLYADGLLEPLTEHYDDISEKLLNTYILGEHVGAAWELERIMRWTPAIVEVDVLRVQSPDTVLRSSGLYKVRGATVEGVVGGIFHQFGGLIAHRVFHTRILPYIYKIGLPTVFHSKMREACQRLGGEHGSLIPSPQKGNLPGTRTRKQSGAGNFSDDDRPQSVDSTGSPGRGHVEFAKVGNAGGRQRIGFTG